jgi:histidine decarboxylase
MGWLGRRKRSSDGHSHRTHETNGHRLPAATGTFRLPLPRPEPDAELAALEERLRRARPYNIGFPGATDFDYTALAPFFAHHLLNNVGDPFVDGAGTNHTKEQERYVVGVIADLLRAPADDRWGYITAGGSEGNLYALHTARSLHPAGVVYHSAAAHYSVQTAVQLLGLPACQISVDAAGRMDYDDLARRVAANGSRPAIVVATVGTTMTEAVDDVRCIAYVVRNGPSSGSFIHADAALAGLPLALCDPQMRPGMDFADGADSVTISGHKFLGSPVPCGVVVTLNRHRGLAPEVDYTASPNSTLGCSRSGHAPLVLWYALRRLGIDGLRRRAEESRRLARHLIASLQRVGWPAYRHEHAFTVVLRTPPPAVTEKWVLASSNGWSHIVCMPGVTQAQLDAFVADLDAAAHGVGLTVVGTARPVLTAP